MIELTLFFLYSYKTRPVSLAVGFGSELLLLPIFSSVVGIKSVFPILTIAQIFGNASNVWFGRHELKFKSIISFLLNAIPLTILGSSLFFETDSNKIKIENRAIIMLFALPHRLNLTETLCVVSETFKGLAKQLAKIKFYNRFSLVGFLKLHNGVLIGKIMDSLLEKGIIKKWSRMKFINFRMVTHCI